MRSTSWRLESLLSTKGHHWCRIQLPWMDHNTFIRTASYNKLKILSFPWVIANRPFNDYDQWFNNLLLQGLLSYYSFIIIVMITLCVLLFCWWYTLCFYKNNFTRTKALILAKNLGTSYEQRQVCYPTEHKNKLSWLAILKIIGTKHQNRARLSLILYCM